MFKTGTGVSLGPLRLPSFLGLIVLLTLFNFVSEGRAQERKTHFGVQGAIIRFADEMKQAGVEITREWIDWEQIEPAKNQYDWTHMDEKVKLANQAGIEILGYFVHMPSWAKKDTSYQFRVPKKSKMGKKPKSSDFCEPRDIDDFRRLAKTVAERYDGKHGYGEMKYFGILNEVTLQEFFDFNNPGNPYETWLINGYEGIKEGNPEARVLIGAFFDPIDISGGSAKPQIEKFIIRMLKNYSQYYDIVNFHSYSRSAAGIKQTTRYIKGLMEIYNVNKPMWITETASLVQPRGPAQHNEVAKDLLKRYVMAFGEGAGKVFWYTFVGQPTPDENPQYGSPAKTLGLGWDFPKHLRLGHSLHPRQAFYTYKLMTSKLSGFDSVEKISDTQYKFNFKDKNPVYVLWCDYNSCLSALGLTGIVKVTDYLGKEQREEASGILLTPNPIFVE